MSDVVAVALITSLATVTGSLVVTFLSHKLQVARDREAERRARIQRAREPIADFLTASERFLIEVAHVADTRISIATDPNFEPPAATPELVVTRDKLSRAWADLVTLVDDQEFRELASGYDAQRFDVAALARTALDDPQAIEKYRLAIESAPKVHLIAARMHERVTKLIQTT